MDIFVPGITAGQIYAYRVAGPFDPERGLRFDPSKPDGQPRRMLDVTRAREQFDFAATTDFREGLKRTIDWYRTHRT